MRISVAVRPWDFVYTYTTARRSNGTQSTRYSKTETTAPTGKTEQPYWKACGPTGVQAKVKTNREKCELKQDDKDGSPWHG